MCCWKGKRKERKGKERKGKERKGKERTGKERKGRERKGKERNGKERKGKERKGKEKEKERKKKKAPDFRAFLVLPQVDSISSQGFHRKENHGDHIDNKHPVSAAGKVGKYI